VGRSSHITHWDLTFVRPISNERSHVRPAYAEAKASRGSASANDFCLLKAIAIRTGSEASRNKPLLAPSIEAGG
jgi:hypothetical protein